MKAMKFSPYYIMLLLAPILVLQSCKDENEGPGASFSFEEQAYSIVNGYLEDAGEVVTVQNEAPSHYAHTVYLSDADLNSEETELDGTFVLLFNLYKPVSTSNALSAGKFDFLSTADVEAGNEDLEGVSFFFTSFLILDLNNTPATFRDITGGTIDVTGSGDDISIRFDLDFSLGKNIKGTFKGPFEQLIEN